MRILLRASLAAISLAFSLAPIRTQAAVEEIVVTSSRRDYDSLDTPHITFAKRADNLITKVRIVCDTRDISQRKEELRTTLKNMVKSAAQDSSIGLGLGEQVIGAFNESMIEAAIFPDKKADTSFAELLVKTSVTPNDTFDSATARIKGYINKVPKAGRTEILREEKWDLTLINVERYRSDLIALIVKDAKQTGSMIGVDSQVTIQGLQLPISWYQSGPLDLALYIAYKLEVRSPK